MFKIKYKIFDDSEDEIEGNEFHGEIGYFQLIVGDSEYGAYLDKEVDIVSVSIYWWMRYFVEATLKLREENPIYISDIETPRVWIELAKQNDNTIIIGKIESPKLEGSSAIESGNKIEKKKIDWEEKINFEEYNVELISAFEKYLNDLNTLNTQENCYIEELEKLLDQLKNNEDI
ncbi:hypothetical protein [Enterococcus plantarum]|uniref:hypothetical protein n=1 Tax=Enterococcus plantarum TaxID=1077675 RepID=UPI001A8CB004|nr:hypothetical protein [Enterococcus plantarum]MBO0424014.1 hypothetical protein [Enterococcus plantarum]